MASREIVDDQASQESEGDVIMQDQNEDLVNLRQVAPILNAPPPVKRQRKVFPLPETPFAGPYNSTFALNLARTTPTELDCLKHVNCSYISTPGLPPTLLQLKQHAQALTVLIKHMTVSTQASVIDNKSMTGISIGSFNVNESFDWLNDLTEPYKNEDRHHQMPLTSLLNNVGSLPAPLGKWVDMCPMHRADTNAPRNGVSLPYATHQTLIQHANEVLELLDHEYSAKGGLLSILPPPEEEEERKLAETTLLGQLILYTSRLVQRVHDLEHQYASTLDVIKGEAAAPRQALSLLGPHGRQPREMVYPQDRFVLVNAGDDVWQYLNNEFQIKEAADDEAELKARDQGVAGEALWENGEGKNFARGITALDIMTRYYRLRNDSLDTVFVVPAYQEHPGTRVTRDIQSQPTVVSVVKPVWPERASVLEIKHRDDMKELKLLRQQNELLQVEANNATESMKAVFMDQQLKAQELRELKSQSIQDLTVAHAETQRLSALVKEPIAESQWKVNEESRAAAEAKRNALLAEEEFKKTQALDQELKKAEQLTQNRRLLVEKERAKLKYIEETMQSKFDSRKKILDARDAEIAKAAISTNEKLKAMWEEQIIEQQILIEFLKRTNSAALQIPQEPSKEDKAKGAAIAKQIMAVLPASVPQVTTGNSARISGQSSVPGGERTGINATFQSSDLNGAKWDVNKVDPANLPSKLGIPLPAKGSAKNETRTGNIKATKGKPIRVFRNKNNLVTYDLSDVANVELVDAEFADVEDEGEESGKEEDVLLE